MARFSGNQLLDDDDEDEIVVKEKRGHSWQERWWKNGGGPLPNKEEGEILEPDDNDNIEFLHHIDEPPTSFHQQLVRHYNHSDDNRYDSINHNEQPSSSSTSSWNNQSNYRQENRNNDLSSETYEFPSYELYPRHLEHDFTNLNRNHNKKMSPWKKYLIVLLVAIILQRYCPPPPPRQNHQLSTTDDFHREVQYNDHEMIHYSWGGTYVYTYIVYYAMAILFVFF